MKTKKVNRYWCDFCNKAGLQAGAMRRHEQHCTLNIARTCRVCPMLADGLDTDELEAKKPLADLIAMLPDSTPYNEQSCCQTYDESEHAKLIASMVDIMPAFRRAAGNCPACMMAALRLAKIPVPMVEDFNFTEEMKDVFANIQPRQGYDY